MTSWKSGFVVDHCARPQSPFLSLALDINHRICVVILFQFHFFDDISGDPSSLLDDFTPPASAAAATFQLSPSIFNCNSNSSNGTGNESQTVSSSHYPLINSTVNKKNLLHMNANYLCILQANFSEELISQLPLSAGEVPDKFDKPLHLLTRQDESVSEIGRSSGGVFGANVFVVKASSGAKRNSFSLVSSRYGH